MPVSIRVYKRISNEISKPRRCCLQSLKQTTCCQSHFILMKHHVFPVFQSASSSKPKEAAVGAGPLQRQKSWYKLTLGETSKTLRVV